MEHVQNICYQYIKNIWHVLSIHENSGLSNLFHNVCNSLNENTYFKFILPFLCKISIFLFLVMVALSVAIALTCICFFLPMFLTIITMSAFSAYYYVLVFWAHITGFFQ